MIHQSGSLSDRVSQNQVNFTKWRPTLTSPNRKWTNSLVLLIWVLPIPVQRKQTCIGIAILRWLESLKTKGPTKIANYFINWRTVINNEIALILFVLFNRFNNTTRYSFKAHGNGTSRFAAAQTLYHCKTLLGPPLVLLAWFSKSRF